MKERIQKSTVRWGLKASVLMLFFSIFSFVLLPYLLNDVNAATEVSAGVSWEPITLTLNTGGDVAFGNITPSTDGTMRIVKRNVSVTTNGRALDVYLSMSGSTSNRLEYGDGSSSIAIDATTGTWDAPAGFSTGSAWGYAIQEKTAAGAVAGTSDTPIYDTNFSAGSVYSGLDSLLTNEVSGDIMTGETGYKAGTWAAVPLASAPQKVWSTTTTKAKGFGTDTSDTDVDTKKGNFNVYYGVVADTDLVAGSYSNTVMYTAIASQDSLTEVSDNILVENTTSNGLTAGQKRFVAEGDTLQLKFDLAQGEGELIDSTKIKVYLVPHTTVAGAATKTVNYSTGTKTVISEAGYATIESGKAGYPTCTVNSATITDDSTVGAVVNCTISEGAEVLGNNDGKGEYDVWVNIPSFGGTNGVNYISKYTKAGGGDISTLAFVGLQSKDSSGTVVSEMQDMTTSVCKNTNKWGKGVGDDAKLYDYTGESLVASGTTGLTEGTGTFRLKDNRDNNTYLIRRLADGNCWMVQNLDLALVDAVNGTITLNRTNTDLNNTTKYSSDTDKYIPSTFTPDELNSKIGVAQALVGGITGSNTFQPRGTSGGSYRWGSLINENGETLAADCSNKTNSSATVNGSLCIENNSRSAIPRSYDNGADWINNDGGYNISTVNSGKGENSNGDRYKDATVSGNATPVSAVGDNADTQYIGDWYNWYAATAESGTFAMASGTAEDSICPRGWQLPSNAGDKSYYNLLTGTYYPEYKTVIKALNTEVCTAAGGTVADSGRCVKDGNNLTSATEWIDSITSTGGSRMLRSYPLSFIFSGNYYWVYGGLSNRGTSGYYWSSTPYATTYSRSLYFYSSFVNPQYGYSKTNGFTVRCVAR